MIVGLTYDLREDYLAAGYGLEETAEFDKPETIEALDEALRQIGYDVVRIGNVKALAERLVQGERWDLVFNIAEGLRGIGRESQVPTLLEAYDIPFTFSDPMVLSLSLHKGMSKHALRSLGVPTPDFQVVEELSDLDDFNLPFPVFAKPVAEGTGKGISGDSRVTSTTKLREVVERLLSTFDQPVLLERYLPGREFTVGIAGTGKKARVLGVMEVILLANAEQSAYSYENKENWRGRIDYAPVDDSEAREAAAVALAAWRGLGCRDGGRIDIRSDENNRPHFIEVNPLAGLNPIDSDLPMLCRFSGISYLDLIGQIMDSAMERVNGCRGRSASVETVSRPSTVGVAQGK